MTTMMIMTATNAPQEANSTKFLNEFRAIAKQDTPPTRSDIGRSFAKVIQAFNDEGAQMHGPRSKGSEAQTKLFKELNQAYRKFGYPETKWNTNRIVNNKNRSANNFISPSPFDSRFNKHGNRYYPAENKEKPAKRTANRKHGGHAYYVKPTKRQLDFMPA